MLVMSTARQAVSEATKAAPPVAVVTAALAGVDLQTWVYIAALVYTVLQIAFLGWKWVREWRNGHKPKVAPTVPPDR